MAGNFWKSSQYEEWLLDRQELLLCRQKDARYLTNEEIDKLHIFFANFIQAICCPLKMRQQVIATAMVYFKRFYLRNSLGSVDPRLMATTCVLLASKVEECGVILVQKIVAVCQSVVKKSPFLEAFHGDYPYQHQNFVECEFYLLEMMDCCLVVYHPYRSLTQYVADIGQEENLLPQAWRIINDAYRSHICLLYPPYLIALACLHMSCVIHQRDCRQWFAELSVDFTKVLEVTREIMALYRLWQGFDEVKEIPALLQKAPKPKTSPSRPGNSSNAGRPHAK